VEKSRVEMAALAATVTEMRDRISIKSLSAQNGYMHGTSASERNYGATAKPSIVGRSHGAAVRLHGAIVAASSGQVSKHRAWGLET
jgi:hypothetical protein